VSEEKEIPVKVVDRRWWARPEGSTPAADEPARKPTYIEELERQLAEKDKAAQEYLAKYRAASQEFESARARMRKELAKDAERSRREVLVSLLEVVDNLDRAIDAALRLRSEKTEQRRSGQAPPDEDALLQGVQMVRDQFLAKLEGFGITRIGVDGAAFDPQLHEAVSAVPANDPALDGRIVGLVRHGYRIGDEVLRPALVAVARHGEPIADH
jgi:molecular chaperone GrpE